MTGYTLPHLSFAVEQHRGEWVMRAALAGDSDASGHPEALAAIASWRDRNRAKYEALRRG